MIIDQCTPNASIPLEPYTQNVLRRFHYTRALDYVTRYVPGVGYFITLWDRANGDTLKSATKRLDIKTSKGTTKDRHEMLTR